MRILSKCEEKLESVCKALTDDGFLDSLDRTLQAWGIGARASNLASFDVFVNRLQAKANEIAGLEKIRIDDKDICVGEVGKRLWASLNSLGIVTNDATIVRGTKTSNHLLPDLVVPIDRAYTQKFFGWHNPEFQYGQPDVFRFFLPRIRGDRKCCGPRLEYVGVGWCSSRTKKIIGNAIVANGKRKKLTRVGAPDAEEYRARSVEA